MENKKKQITPPELDVKFIKPNYSEETMLEVIKTPIPPMSYMPKPNYSEETMLEVIKTPIPPITYMPPVHKEK